MKSRTVSRKIGQSLRRARRPGPEELGLRIVGILTRAALKGALKTNDKVLLLMDALGLHVDPERVREAWDAVEAEEVKRRW